VSAAAGSIPATLAPAFGAGPFKPVATSAWRLPKAAKRKGVVITAKATYRGQAFATKHVVISVR